MAEKAQDAKVEATEAKQNNAPEVSEAQKNPEKFLKEFNWHNYQEGIDEVDDLQLKEFEKLVAENFVDTLDDEVVEGTVVHISDRDAIIDINAKSEGVISLNEFRYNPDLAVGDEVEVIVEKLEINKIFDIRLLTMSFSACSSAVAFFFFLGCI